MTWTFVYFVLALFLLVMFHEAGHFLAARTLGVKVLRFSFGFGKVLFRWHDQRGTEYVWSLIPLGGYVKMLDDADGAVPLEERAHAFNHQSVWARILIVAAGPVFNLLFAWFALTTAFVIGLPSVPVVMPVVGVIEPHTPAAQAGLMTGDRIIAVNNQSIRDWSTLATYVRARPNESIVLAILHEKERKQIHVKLGQVVEHGIVRGWLGIRAVKPDLSQIRIQHMHPWDAIKLAGIKTWALTCETFVMIGRLIHEPISIKQLSGPLGIAQYAGASAHAGIAHYLSFLAFISISLGVLNALPIPMLDGGYLLYYLIEIVTKKPVSVKVQQKAAYVGLILLTTLMIVAVKNDLTRLNIMTLG
jgi:regulator of sigma E protease